MKNHNAKKNDSEPEAARVSSLAGWQAALEQIRTGNGELAEIGASLERLGAETSQLGADRKFALEHEDTESLSRCLARGEILATRREKLQAQLADAQERSANTLGHAIGRFSVLARIFHGFVFEREKKRLQDSMIDGCPIFSIDQVTLYLRPVADVRALEIAQDAGQSVEGFIGSGERLLAALEAASDFTVPEFVPLSTVSGVGAESAEQVAEADDWIGPWDIGDGTNIDGLCREIDASEPGLTRLQIDQKLRELRPDLYKRRSEVIAMHQTPLSVS